MIKVKIIFVDGYGFEDREEVFLTNDREEAVLQAVDKMPIEEIKYILSFDSVSI